MSSSVSYFKIGLFTLTGVTLIVVMIVALGVGAALQQPEYLETYFDDSVQGLAVGAPVKFRGRKMGTVAKINLVGNRYPELDNDNPAERTARRYVYVLISVEGDKDLSRRTEEELKREWTSLSKEGIRIRLAAQGITGLAYLEADFVDNVEAALPIYWEPVHSYIPSVRSTMSRLTDSLVDILASLRNVPFREIGDNLKRLLETLDATTRDAKVDDLSVEVLAILRRIREIVEKPGVDTLAENAANTMSDIRGLVEALSPEIKSLEKKLGTAVERIGVLANDVHDLVSSDEVKMLLKELPGASVQLKLTLQRLSRVIGTNENNINTVMRNLKIVSDNLQKISVDLREYPAQVLFGEEPHRSAIEAE
jgi:ABC-type transporter Mla subunit MlaD